MRSDLLRSGQEVLSDPSYLRVCRAVFAFRLLATAMTSALTPTDTPAPHLLLALVAVLSAWAMLDNGYVRRYFRHPGVAGLDVLLVTVLVAIEWPDTLGLLVLALTMLTVGLTLTPWLGLPALVMSTGLAITYTTQVGDPRVNGLAAGAAIGLPISLLGMTALGWTVRYAFVELQRSRDQAMSEAVARRELEERNRLAREMHDSLGKTVHGIGMAATALTGAARAGQLEDTHLLSAEIASAARTAAEESRSLLRGLRRHLDDRPFAEQLGELARSRAGDGLSVRTEVTGLADLDRALGGQVLAIVDEALENVVRHARADHVSVLLHRGDGELVLTVTDDGVGLRTSEIRSKERQGHFGLRGMRERAMHTGGTLEVVGTPGAGTTVRCRWPAPTEGTPE
jgi:signal transduction histidine kinase